jgi:hypothetical protein
LDDLGNVVFLPSTFELHPTAGEVRLFRHGRLVCSRTLKDFLSIPYLNEEMFVTDVRWLVPRLPEIEPGDSLWVSKRYRVEPFLGFPVYSFAIGSLEVKSSTYVATVPKSLNPKFLCFNDAPPPEINEKDNKVTLTWRVKDIPSRIEEELGLSPEDLAPIVSIGTSRIAWGPSGTWQELGATYWKQAQTAIVAVEGASSNLPTKLGSSSALEDDLFKVQSNVRYVAMALGPGGKIPHRSDEVLRKRYGDCKDMSVLLLSMLGSDANHASLALVNTLTGDHANVDPLPTLSYFNHAVVCASTSSGIVWLDATDSEGTARFPRPDIQGAPALVVTGPASGFRRIPLTGPAENESAKVLRLQEQFGTWTATMTITTRGYRAHELRRRIKTMEDASKIITKAFEGSHLNPNAILADDVRWITPTADSVVLTGTTVVHPSFAQGAYTISWNEQPYPLDIFRERERRDDVYWPALETFIDSVTVLTSKRFSGAKDTTWSAVQDGLEVRVLRNVIQGGIQEVRTVAISKTPFAASSWAGGRDIRTKMTRWSTRPIPLGVP